MRSRKLASAMAMLMTAVTLLEPLTPVFAASDDDTVEEVVIEDETEPEENGVVEEDGDAAYSIKSITEQVSSNYVRVKVEYVGDDYPEPSECVLVISYDDEIGKDEDENGHVDVLSEGETAMNTTYNYAYWGKSGENIYYTYTAAHLSCNTEYYYRLALEDYYGDGYTYFTPVRSFTTSPATTESKVSFTDARLEAGYAAARLEWSIDNPNDEYIDGYRLYYGDGVDDYMGVYSDSEYGRGVYYYSELEFDGEEELSLTPAWSVYINDELKWVKAKETIKVKPAKLTDASVTVTDASAGAASFATEVVIDPFYEVDCFNLKMTVFYKTEDSDHYVQTSNGIYDANSSVVLTGLESNTNYKYYLEISENSYGAEALWSYGSEDAPKTFKTLENKKIDPTVAFPDETLRALVLDEAGISEDEELYTSDLERITSLDSEATKDDKKYITDITGVELLRNLTSIDLPGHDIKDLSPVLSLKRLQSLNMAYNDITAFPDMSGMTKLTYLVLEGNLIPAAQVTTAKMPPNVSNIDVSQIKESQRKPFAAVYAPGNTYYAIGETHPFIVAYEGLKESYREYAATVTLGDTVKELKKSSYDSSVFYCADMGSDISGEKTVNVEFKENGLSKKKEDIKVTFAGDEEPVMETLSGYGDSNYDVNGNVSGKVSQNGIEKLRLTDAGGKTVNASCKVLRVKNQNEEVRYNSVFSISELKRQYTVVYADVRPSRLLEPGVYSLYAKLQGAAEEVKLAGLTVTTEPIVTYWEFDDSYDNGRDYAYLALYGINLSETAAPAIMLSGEKAAEYEEWFAGTRNGYGGDVVLKYKKSDKGLWTTGTVFDLSFAEGVHVTFSDLTVKFDPYSRPVLFSYYNYRKEPGELVAVLSKMEEIKDGAEIKVEVLDYGDNVIATGTSKVKDHAAAFSCRKAGSEDVFEFPYDGDNLYRLRYTIEGLTGSAVDSWITRYNYYEPSVSTTEPEGAYLTQSRYFDAGVKNVDIKFAVFNKSLEGVEKVYVTINGGEKIEASEDATAETATDKKFYKVSFEFDEEISEGYLDLQYYGDDNSINGSTLYAVGERFTQTAQDQVDDSINGNKRNVGIEIASPRAQYDYVLNSAKATPEDGLAYWKRKELAVTFYDVEGNELTASGPTEVKWDKNYITVYYDIPAEYCNVYAKVTADGKILPYFGKTTSYYAKEMVSEEYGCFLSFPLYAGIGIHGSGNDEKGWSAYNRIESYGEVELPMTCKFKNPGSGEVISSFTIDELGVYYITEDDMKGLDVNEVYTLSVVAVNGISASATGYFGYGAGTNKPDPSKVKLESIKISGNKDNIAEGNTQTLTLTLNPKNATVTGEPQWTSSDPAVLKVEKGTGLTAVVTALKGSTSAVTIKATYGGKSDTVTYSKVKDRIAATKISVTPETLSVMETRTAKLTATVEPADCTDQLSWSSSDAGIATVVSDGDEAKTATVTGVKTGTCEITVKAGDKTAKVSVTVTEKKDIPVESLSLNKAELTLDMDAEETLTVIYTPDDAENKNVIWSSSDANRVTVDENGKVKAWKTTTTPVEITAAWVGAPDKVKTVCKVTVTDKNIRDTDEITVRSKEDVETYVVPKRVTVSENNLSVKISKNRYEKVSISAVYWDAITFKNKKITKDDLKVDVDLKGILEGLHITGKDPNSVLAVKAVFKNNKNATQGVLSDKKKAYFYLKLSVTKNAKNVLDKEQLKALKKTVTAVNKALKKKKCFFTINKASLADVNTKAYFKNATVAVNSKGAVKGLKKVTVFFSGDSKETKLATSQFDKKNMKPDVTANKVTVTGKKNYTGSVRVKAQ